MKFIWEHIIHLLTSTLRTIQYKQYFLLIYPYIIFISNLPSPLFTFTTSSIKKLSFLALVVVTRKTQYPTVYCLYYWIPYLFALLASLLRVHIRLPSHHIRSDTSVCSTISVKMTTQLHVLFCFGGFKFLRIGLLFI